MLTLPVSIMNDADIGNAPLCHEHTLILKRPGFDVGSIMWMPRSPCRPLSVLHEHRGDAPLLIAALILKVYPQPATGTTTLRNQGSTTVRK